MSQSTSCRPSCHRTRDAERSARAGEASPEYHLRVFGDGRQFPLEPGPTCNIGSADDNNLVLADPYVSKHHCRLVGRQRGLWIEDCHSRNGTWVNSVRVERCQLRGGARISLGRTLLYLLRGNGQQPAFGLVGQSQAMRRVIEQVVRLAASDRPVLICGETGTGKELVARALHECSAGRLGPFEPLNCGAIPRELAETELFGHAQGAFTGATRERRGAFERASGGTLFLDEIGEMALDLQPKLLRVLEERAVQRVGDEQRRPVRVRLLAASNRDLTAEAERGRFRLDLYHRLAVGVVQLPPLRERSEDIPLLARHFLQQASEAGRIELDEEAIALLQEQAWRGNVRELRHTLQRAALQMVDSGPLRVSHLRAVLQPSLSVPPPSAGLVHVLGRRFDEIRREIYQIHLRACGGSRSAAAAALGIPKSTFFDHLREMSLSY